jgi:gas vesicle protein
MSAKGYWFAFLIGATAGAGVALLYAPATGARTRKRIGRSIDQGVDSLNDAAEYLKEQADNLSKQAQVAIKRTRGKVEDVVEEVVGKASDAVTTVAKGVHSLM